MNARVERDEYGVCDAARVEHDKTTGVRSEQPPVSFCLHRIHT